MAADDQPQMELKIKTTTQSYDIKIAEKATVGELKADLVAIVNSPIEKLCLIFSGKILKDHETLESHGIKNGMSVHLVIRNPMSPSANRSPPTNVAPTAPPTSTAPPTTQASTTRAPSSSSFLASMMRGANPNEMAQQMMSNPDMMRDMMNNPIMQHIMNSPDMLRSLFMENPQIQNIIQRNPELGHLLNDPEVLRQTMEMVRNPNMFQEMMRNHDQAIRNLQGIPGGEAALQRLYQDVQEPLLNSATNSLAGNPFASLVDNSFTTSRSQRAGVENAEALPNPWGSGSSGNTAAPANPSGGGTTAPDSTGISSVMNSAGMQDLMRQMMSNPDGLQSVMRSPSMQNITNSLSQNPEVLRQMFEQSSQLFSQSGLNDQMRQAFPAAFRALNEATPEIMQAVVNPRVQEALRQIQQGYEVLRQEAPQLLRFGMEAATGSATTAAGTGGSTDQGANSGSADNPEALANALRHVLNLNAGSSANTANAPPPEERFRQQLNDLRQMGFDNEAANIQALLASLGDVSGAIEFLLNQQGSQ
ncbi:hypothetical protein QR680_009389 [Steinernema hermaphroditum]|uniref:Ubiquilin n=1 Tax=Steinernema hermaphroditum TaxID=289476 RepID=A0AA39M9S8_9BILA|nr:hypothetical protein QR680_009389 [Steinernema hermaphroditum]